MKLTVPIFNMVTRHTLTANSSVGITITGIDGMTAYDQFVLLEVPKRQTNSVTSLVCFQLLVFIYVFLKD